MNFDIDTICIIVFVYAYFVLDITCVYVFVRGFAWRWGVEEGERERVGGVRARNTSWLNFASKRFFKDNLFISYLKSQMKVDAYLLSEALKLFDHHNDHAFILSPIHHEHLSHIV